MVRWFEEGGLRNLVVGLRRVFQDNFGYPWNFWIGWGCFRGLNYLVWGYQTGGEGVKRYGVKYVGRKCDPCSF